MRKIRWGRATVPNPSVGNALPHEPTEGRGLQGAGPPKGRGLQGAGPRKGRSKETRASAQQLGQPWA